MQVLEGIRGVPGGHGGCPGCRCWREYGGWLGRRCQGGTGGAGFGVPVAGADARCARRWLLCRLAVRWCRRRLRAELRVGGFLRLRNISLEFPQEQRVVVGTGPCPPPSQRPPESSAVGRQSPLTRLCPPAGDRQRLDLQQAAEPRPAVRTPGSPLRWPGAPPALAPGLRRAARGSTRGWLGRPGGSRSHGLALFPRPGATWRCASGRCGSAWTCRRPPGACPRSPRLPGMAAVRRASGSCP